MGKQTTGVISKDLLLLAEDLDAWNVFPWGSYTWSKVWEQLSTHKNKSHMKYTLTGMFWAFKAFPHMRTLAKKTSNDIPRAINWERKSQFKWSQLELCVSINDVADLPLQTLTPTEDEAATDWWQASKRFFDGVDDVDPPMFHTLDGGIDQGPPRHRDPSPLPFTHRADPPSSPPPFTHRANGADFPLSPPHTRPTKMPRVYTSSVSPHSNIHSRHPQGDHVTSIDEIHALRDEVRALQEIVVPLQQEVRVVDVLREEVRALREIVLSLEEEVRVTRTMVSPFQEEVHELHDEMDDTCYSEPDQSSAFRYSDMLVSVRRRGLRLRRLGPSIISPYTPFATKRRIATATTKAHVSESQLHPVSEAHLVSKTRPVLEAHPVSKTHPVLEIHPVSEAHSVSKTHPVLEIHPISEALSYPVLEAQPIPDSKTELITNKKPKRLLDMKLPRQPPLDSDYWLTFKLPPNTIPLEDRFKLPETIEDNSVWAKTAVEFYLHEKGQGCYSDFSRYRLRNVRLDRKWWGTLLGVEERGYFDTSHVDAWKTQLLIRRKREIEKSKDPKLGACILTNTRWSIMPSSFNDCELSVGTNESYMFANGLVHFILHGHKLIRCLSPFVHMIIGFLSSFSFHQ